MNRRSNQFNNSDVYGLSLGMSANQFKEVKNNKIQFKKGEIEDSSSKYNVSQFQRFQRNSNKSTEQLIRYERLPTLAQSHQDVKKANQTSISPNRISRHQTTLDVRQNKRSQNNNQLPP